MLWFSYSFWCFNDVFSIPFASLSLNKQGASRLLLRCRIYRERWPRFERSLTCSAKFRWIPTGTGVSWDFWMEILGIGLVGRSSLRFLNDALRHRCNVLRTWKKKWNFFIGSNWGNRTIFFFDFKKYEIAICRIKFKFSNRELKLKSAWIN